MIRPARLAAMAALAIITATATDASADEPPPGWGTPPAPPSPSPLLPEPEPPRSPPAFAAPDPAPPPSASPAPGAPAKKGRGVWRSFRAGSDLVGSAPTAAILDGSWTLTTHLNTTLIDRTWMTPRPYGTIGHYTRRFLYGLSWSLMLGIESLITIGAKGGIDWIGAATYRTDWMIPLDMPACTQTGENGGCGIGLGNMAFISVSPRHSKWWFEAGGGWYEQRVFVDALRTLGESTGTLNPLTVLREISTDPEGVVALRWLVGGGVYAGIHAAHMHPTVRGQDAYPNFRTMEYYPFEGGVGPGARTELQIVILRHLTLEGDLTFAPLFAGAVEKDPPRDVEPLDYARSGTPVWRKLDFGIGFQDYRLIAFKPTLSFFGAELSGRPVERLGYRGVMLRFDIPLRVPGD